MPEGRDELRHEPDGSDPFWNESWYLDFHTADGSLGGYVRLGLYPNQGVAWWWACLVGDDRPLVTLRSHDVPMPPPKAMEIRDAGVWATVNVETPLEHVSVGLEAFAVALDDPADCYRGERGDVVAFGLDLEWEAAGPVFDYPGVARYEQAARVHGEILVGDERIDFDGLGERDHSWGSRDWWKFPWCWTSGWLEDGTAFHASRPEIEGVRYEPGFVLTPDGELQPQFRFEVAVQEAGAVGEHLPVSSHFGLGPLELDVVQVHHAPVWLPSPPGDGRPPSRLARSLARFTEADGRTGWGWTEFNQVARSR